MRISIHVATKNRPTELTLLMQSLRTQTLKNWDLVIRDESDVPFDSSYFGMNMLNRIRQEGHYVNLFFAKEKLGVCYARQKLIDKDHFNNEFICRLDDDVVIESDYLMKLMSVIEKGYDIASGITPHIGAPLIKRKTEHVKPIINYKEFDKEGNIIKYGDDCGMGYLTDEIIETDEFRSCALMKKEVVKRVKYPDNLTPVGFREEGFFSFMARDLGFKIGVHTGAIAWHFQTPSGGCRYSDYQKFVQIDDTYFKKWVKEKWMNSKKLKRK